MGGLSAPILFSLLRGAASFAKGFEPGCGRVSVAASRVNGFGSGQSRSEKPLKRLTVACVSQPD
jgi:hypothetical protein